MPVAVADRSSNKNEQIVHAAEEIGRSPHRRVVFKVIYTGKKRHKTVSELIDATKLPHRRVLDAGKRLADAEIVHQIRVDGETAYEKVPFLQSYRDKILRAATDRKTRERIPTKRSTRTARSKSVRLNIDVRLPRARVLATHITVDDIDSFKKVRAVTAPSDYIRMKEVAFKKGLQGILLEKGSFKDWGGELSDLFSTRLRVGGSRRVAALALKGPGTSGTLTPRKMGKNGDQIQRLARCTAEVFLVQYWADIDHSILELLEKLVQWKSYLERRPLWYGVIDGDDSARIILAYRALFPAVAT